MKLTFEQKMEQRAADLRAAQTVAGAVLQALSNPLVAGLAGYGAVSLAAQVKGSDGKPMMSDAAVNTLKGVAVGFPLAQALGGWPGLIAGTVGGSAAGGVNVGNVASSLASNFFKALVGFP